MHYFDVYESSIVVGLIMLLLGACISAAITFEVGLPVVAVATYKLSTGIVEFGYQFFKLPKFVPGEIPTLQPKDSFSSTQQDNDDKGFQDVALGR